MKIQRFDFYWSIVTALIAVIVAAAVAFFFSSCEPIEALMPDDWPIHVVDNDTIPQDSVVIDTLPTDTITILPDTCESLTEVTDPAFVTLYIKFDSPQSNLIWEGGGQQSANLADIIPFITSNSFKAYASESGAWVIINGTNNHTQYQLKVFTRIGGAKWYMGAAKQALILPGTNYDQFMQNATEFQSVNQFSFYGCDFDSLQTEQIARVILGDCKAGRWYADFYFSPDISPELIDSFELAGWDRIRQ